MVEREHGVVRRGLLGVQDAVDQDNDSMLSRRLVGSLGPPKHGRCHALRVLLVKVDRAHTQAEALSTRATAANGAAADADMARPDTATVSSHQRRLLHVAGLNGILHVLNQVGAVRRS